MYVVNLKFRNIFNIYSASTYYIFFSFFLSKISPELTSASNPPLFLLRKTSPELTSMPIFLYFM